MMNKLKILTVCVAFVVFFSVDVFSQQNQYQVVISTGSRLMSQSEKFEFGIGNQKITVDLLHPQVAFPNKFNAGQSINLFQISGPRPCTTSNGNLQNSIIMPNQDFLIVVNCGTPPTSRFALEVYGIQIGETFRFIDNYGRLMQFSINQPQSLNSPPPNAALEIPLGDSYLVTQTSGPRQCLMTNNQGVSPNTNFIIRADCTATVQQAQFRLGIKNVGQVTSMSDKFEFFYGNNQKILLDSTHPEVYFADKFVTGQSFTIKQLSSSRPCNFAGSNRGTFANQDILVTVDCGSAPTNNLKLKTIGVAPKETFTFTDNYNRTIDITGSTTTDLGKFIVGDTYSVKQEEGTRRCKLTDNKGIVSVDGKRELLVIADCTIAAQYTVSVQYSNALMSKNDKFDFSINGGERITVDWNHRKVDFVGKINNGQQYSVTQVSGSRTCSFWRNNQQGTIANDDVEIGINCGFPPRVNGTLTVSGIEQNETFVFANEYGTSYDATINKTYPIQNFPIGDNYIFKQLGGPRQCRMTNATGTVTNASIAITADCTNTTTSGTPNPTPITTTTPNPTTPPFTNTFPQIDFVSRSIDNQSFGTFYDSLTPVIGGKGEDEGRYVAFVSYARGLGGATGNSRQIIWRDRKTGETKLVSASPTGEEGNQNSLAPAISADGKSVAFESYATNLISGDANSRRDVFVWQESTGKVERVSTGQGGVEPDYESYEPTISGDGSLIAFTSNATNIIPNIQGISSYNVYLKDMRSGAVQIISLDEKTKKGGGGSNASISEDGSRIAFYNYAPLTSDDKNTLWDIYVWQRGNPKLKRVSLTSERSERDQGSESSSRVISPAISGDGRFVTFATTAKNMVGGDSNGVQDAFITEIDTGRVTRLSLSKDGQEPDSNSPIGQGEKISISYDGSWVVFSSNANNLGGNILLKNVQTGETKIISNQQGITVGRPDISRNGNFVIFGSDQSLDKRFSSSGIFVISNVNH